jgi:hypothetical protein
MLRSDGEFPVDQGIKARKAPIHVVTDQGGYVHGRLFE